MKKSAKIQRKTRRAQEQAELYDEVRQALYIGHSKNFYDPDAAMFKAFRDNIRRRLGHITVPRPHPRRVTITVDTRPSDTLLVLTDTKAPPEDPTALHKRLSVRNAIEQPIIIAVCGDTECLIDGYRRVWYRNAAGFITTKAYIVTYNDWSKHSKKSLPG